MRALHKEVRAGLQSSCSYENSRRYVYLNVLNILYLEKLILNSLKICFLTHIGLSYYVIGEPQEECMRCAKTYIVSSDTSNGLCAPCLGIPLRDPVGSQFRSSGESEEDDEELMEEESSNGGTEFSDK